MRMHRAAALSYFSQRPEVYIHTHKGKTSQVYSPEHYCRPKHDLEQAIALCLWCRTAQDTRPVDVSIKLAADLITFDELVGGKRETNQAKVWLMRRCMRRKQALSYWRMREGLGLGFDHEV